MASPTSGQAADPLDGPIVPRWYYGAILLAMVLGAAFASAAAVPGPLWFRIACASACCAVGILLWAPAGRRVRRLDEFQALIFWQSVAWGAAATVLYVLFMAFYYAISTGAASALTATGMAPGMVALMSALMIGTLERRARRATADFRE